VSESARVLDILNCYDELYSGFPSNLFEVDLTSSAPFCFKIFAELPERLASLYVS